MTALITEGFYGFPGPFGKEEGRRRHENASYNVLKRLNAIYAGVRTRRKRSNQPNHHDELLVGRCVEYRTDKKLHHNFTGRIMCILPNGMYAVQWHGDEEYTDKELRKLLTQPDPYPRKVPRVGSKYQVDVSE